MGPLTLAATCAGIPAQEPFTKSVGRCTATTQTDPPAPTRKTYVAILKSAPGKGAPRPASNAGSVKAAPTNCVIVEGSVRSVEKPSNKPLMIAPKPKPAEKITTVLAQVPAPVPAQVPAPVPVPAPTPVIPVVPKVADIRPTITQEDSMFDWDDIFQQSETPDLFSDIPLSLGSPDSGHGSDFIGSEPELFNNDDIPMDTFNTDISDLNHLSPISDSLDLNSDKFLSEFLTF